MTDGRDSLFQCPDCKAQQSEAGRCGRCPGVVQAVRWDEGPCYICGETVPPSEGWHREDHDGRRRHWCRAHRPVWSWGERAGIARRAPHAGSAGGPFDGGPGVGRGRRMSGTETTPRPDLFSSAAEHAGREGMVTVWDNEGRYLGCMGVNLWAALVAAREASDT